MGITLCQVCISTSIYCAAASCPISTGHPTCFKLAVEMEASYQILVTMLVAVAMVMMEIVSNSNGPVISGYSADGWEEWRAEWKGVDQWARRNEQHGRRDDLRSPIYLRMPATADDSNAIAQGWAFLSSAHWAVEEKLSLLSLFQFLGRLELPKLHWCSRRKAH